MREQFTSEQPQISMEEYRQDFFEQMKRDTRIFNNDEYQRLYIPAKLHFGINSPAFILPEPFFDTHPHSEIIPKDVGERLIAINRDSVSDPDFIRYLEVHEHWELYIDEKEGFSLGEYSKADYVLPILERKRPGHRYATLKEFQAAEEDGKLDEYMQWWRDFYQADIEQIQTMTDEEIERISRNYGAAGGDRNMIVRFIQQNLLIKESIYDKIRSRRNK